MRLATWNVNSALARLPRLVPWLAEVEPDVVCLQETKVPPGGFPVAAVATLGYEVAEHGEGRWNGVAVLSRLGLTEVRRGLPEEPGFPTAQARAIGATCGPLRVWSVYVPNGRTPDSPHYDYKLRWFAALAATATAEATGSAYAVCGDFNVAPTDADVWDPAAFVGATHVTPAERAALGRVQDAGLHDVLPRPLKYDRAFTYWDYRAGMFHQNQGMRIDLVLGNAAFTAAVRDAYVDREARKGRGPSDHAPVVVDLAL